MVLLIKIACDTVYPYPRLFIIGFVLLILSSPFLIHVLNPVVAQTPETSSSTTATGLPTIQITSPEYALLIFEPHAPEEIMLL